MGCARSEGDLVLCEVVAAEFFALVLDDRKFAQVLAGLGVMFLPISLDTARASISSLTS